MTREEAIKMLKDIRHYLCSGNPVWDTNEVAEAIRTAIIDMRVVQNSLRHLKAQKIEQWIPVSERLPEKPNMYTVTDSKGDVVRFVFYDTESSREYWLRCAKAWMPLPEPYTEEKR